MKNVFLLLLALAVLAGCKKETESFQTEPLQDYLPLQTGRYTVYQTDSTVFTNFGTTTVTRSYQEKNVVDAQTTDNLGRLSYRVFRYLRDAAGTGPWKSAGTYFITPTASGIEVVENNLRFLKLASPLRENNSWKGNRFLPTEPYKDQYAFSNDDEGSLPDWDYTYTELNGSFDYKGQTLDEVVTVEQVDESVNAPVTQPGAYGYQNYAVNRYAKGIGLVYEELIMWEYQPNPNGSSGYKVGFGVKRTLIDHN